MTYRFVSTKGGSTMTLVIIAVAWPIVGTAVGVLLGRGIRRADLIEGTA